MDAVTNQDVVVLLDDEGRPCGTADRASVHHERTPRHLAFSCYIFDDLGRVLMTRRALAKRTWPGVWTNACCGHPRPGESFEDAIARRVSDELGAQVDDLSVVLPDFAYRAVDASGIVENEVCPVYAARLVGSLDPDPAEVMEHAWAAPEDLEAVALRAPWLLSPWSASQIGLLDLRSLINVGSTRC